MMRHSRSKSLSDSLIMEDVEKGGVIVRSIRDDSFADKGLKEGDEIIGATIHFDKLKKDEVLRVLKLIEPFDENLEILTKHHLKANASTGTVNNHIASPKDMLKDSYSRLFHSKVKRFLNREAPLCDAAKTLDVKIGDFDGQLCAPGVGLHLEGSSLKDDIEGPTRSQDLSGVSAKTPGGDTVASLMSPKVKWSASKIQDTEVLKNSKPSNNLPKVSTKGSDFPVSSMEPDVDCPVGNLSGPNAKSPDIDLSLKMENINGADINAFGLHGSEVNSDLSNGIEQEGAIETQNTEMPKVCLSEFNPKTPDLEGKFSKIKREMNISITKLNANNKSANINVKIPQSNMNDPNLETHAHFSHLKMPTMQKCGNHAPKMKGLEMDIDGDMKAPGLNLSDPEIKGSERLGVNLPSTDIKGTKLDLKLPSQKLGVNLPKADFSCPELDMKTPDFEIDAPSAKFALPKFNLSEPKMKEPDFDIDAGWKRPNLDLIVPKIKGGIKAPDIDWNLPSTDMKGPKLDLKSPDVDLKATSSKFKFKTLPKFGISGPKFKSQEMNIGGGLKTPDLNFSPRKMKDFNVPELGVNLPKADFSSPELDMKTPDFDIDAPSAKFAMSKLNLPEPKLKGPDFDIDAGLKRPNLDLIVPKIKGGIKAPDIDWNLPSTDVKGPKLDLKSPDVDLKATSSKFKFKTLPKFGISGPKFKSQEMNIGGGLKTPDLNFSAPKMKDFNVPELRVNLSKGDFSSPELDMKTPDFDIDAPSAKFVMPKFNLSEPKLKGPDFDIDAGLKRPNLDLIVPKIKGGIKAPDIDWNSPSTGVKGPKLDLKSQNVDLKPTSSKFKFKTLPKFGISGPKFKSPEMNIGGGLKTPDLNFSAPKMKDFNVPELGVNLSKGDFSSPELDMKTPDFDIDAPSAKFVMPKFNLSEPKLKGPDFDIDAGLKRPNLDLIVPKIKGGIKAPDIDWNSPSTGVKGPKLDLKSRNVDLKPTSSKFKFKTLPKFGISGPKFKSPEMNIGGGLKTPDLNFSPRKMKDFNVPELGVNLPKADFSSPELDMKTPDFDIDAPSAKFAMSKFNLPEPKLKGPDFDIDAGLKRPNLDLIVPKIKGGIKAPDIDWNLPSTDVKGPKLDLKSPDVDLKATSSKFKFKTLPKFGISGPKFKSPEMNIGGGLKTPDLNLSARKMKDFNVPELGVNLPKADFSSPELDMKTPDFDIDAPSAKFAMPKFNLPEPKLKGPDFDIDAGLKRPNLGLIVPKIKGGIKAPDIDWNLPSTDMKGPKLDLKSPDVDLKATSRKFKFKTFPKFGISGPKFKSPEMNIGGGLKTPDLNFSPRKMKDFNVPELGVNLPNADFSSPELDMKTPDFDIDAPSAKFAMPKFNLPEPKLKGPDFDIDTGLKRPNLDLIASKIKGGIKAPDIDWNLPSTDMKGPKLDLKSPDVDLKATSQKLKLKTLPKFGISGPKFKGPEMDISGGLKTPDLDLSALKIKGNVNAPESGLNLPKADFSSPELDMKTPDFDIDAPSGNFTFSNPKMPGPKMKGTDFDIDTDLMAPDFGLSDPFCKLKKTGFKVPDFKHLEPEVQGPDLNVTTSALDLSVPMIKGKISSPGVITNFAQTGLKGSKLDVKTPDLNLDDPSGEWKMPILRNPKYHSELNEKRQQLDIDAVLSEADLSKFSKLKRATNTPDVDLCLLSNDIKSTKLGQRASKADASVHLGKMHSGKKSKSGLSGLSTKGLDLDANLKTQDLNLLTSKNKAGLDVSDIDVNSPKADLKGQADVQISDIHLNNPIAGVNTDLAKVKEYHSPDMESGKVHAEVPTIKKHIVSTNSLYTPDMDLEVPRGTLKRSKLKFNLKA